MIRKGFKRKLLFFLATCADVYSELSVRSFYRKFYAPTYEPERVTEFLSRMAKVGEIEKKIVNGKVVFAISAKGEKLLDEVIPLEKLGQKPWDGWWRIVIFDIEEINRYVRARIRKKLSELGFGMWQESVYISPHPVAEEVNEYFEEKNLYPRCICLEARKTGVEDDQVLADQIFALEELTAKYSKLLQDVNDEVELAKKEKVKSDAIVKKLQSFLERFETLLLVDPFLPKELNPNHEIGEKVEKSLALLSKIVAKTI